MRPQFFEEFGHFSDSGQTKKVLVDKSCRKIRTLQTIAKMRILIVLALWLQVSGRTCTVAYIIQKCHHFNNSGNVLFNNMNVHQCRIYNASVAAQFFELTNYSASIIITH